MAQVLNLRDLCNRVNEEVPDTSPCGESLVSVQSEAYLETGPSLIPNLLDILGLGDGSALKADI